MPPSVAAGRFAGACLLGLALGVAYGFLRPFRRKHPQLADGIFMLFAGWCWLQLSFGICLGDIRFGYTMGLAVGAVFWEMTLGKWLRPVFEGIWWLIGSVFQGIILPIRLFLKKFCVFVKKLFASGKKSGTI